MNNIFTVEERLECVEEDIRGLLQYVWYLEDQVDKLIKQNARQAHMINTLLTMSDVPFTPRYQGNFVSTGEDYVNNWKKWRRLFKHKLFRG